MTMKYSSSTINVKFADADSKHIVADRDQICSSCIKRIQNISSLNNKWWTD